MIVEVFKPSFTTFHETPIVIWQDKYGIHNATNMFVQYRDWKASLPLPLNRRQEPCAAFWDSCGPAIVRALEYCGASALTFERVSDDKVAYKWFARHPDKDRSVEWFCVCDVRADGRAGKDIAVTVTLPTDEDVRFMFHASRMQGWYKETPTEVKS